jgi:FlaA1/EpsC-like NDP-sugar epimerase
LDFLSNPLNLIGRQEPLFDKDMAQYEALIKQKLVKARCLVIGGAGTIGQAVTRELFKCNPLTLHVVDISENNMVELVRDIRSTIGYGEIDFRTFAIDCGSIEFQVLCDVEGPYDYVFNLSALKHVRSEKDPFTLMRMIQVNILNTVSTIKLAKKSGAKKYFCVSTDKAANPVNMMGASKRIMELFLMRESLNIDISMSRFANVAFSDGSLLHGFNQRFLKRQPFSAPSDVRRYFMTPQESGQLCLISGILGENRDIFFPKLSEKLNLITFAEIAEKYLINLGYEPYKCETENEARKRANELIGQKKWPCYFFKTDTTGEKDFEEFYTDGEILDMSRLLNIGVIRNAAIFNEEHLQRFQQSIFALQSKGVWSKADLVKLFIDILPNFTHLETGKYLDQRM